MKFLGIDYGRKKIGLAVSDGVISEPWKVIRYDDEVDGLEKVKQAAEEQSVATVVFGLSDGEKAKETKGFVVKLGRKLSCQIVFQDESLSTQDAQELSIGAGIKRKKRKEMEDAYSAAIILQAYLDGLK